MELKPVDKSILDGMHHKDLLRERDKWWYVNRVSELERENEELKRDAAWYRKEAADRIVALEIERSGLKQDAARYRWLRAGKYPLSVAHSVLNDAPHGIDAFIDAALVKKGNAQLTTNSSEGAR